MTDRRALWALAPLLLAAAAAGGCASKDLYSAGQGWQRQECIKMPDMAQRQRCLDAAGQKYEDYQREATTARSGT